VVGEFAGERAVNQQRELAGSAVERSTKVFLGVISTLFVLFVVETTSQRLSNERAKSAASRQAASAASETKSTAQSVPQPTHPHSWAVSEETDPVQGTPVVVLKLYSARIPRICPDNR
jgi:hypothetical protein